ncbi:MAG: radical SAM protein [Elusimicrobia bacterium CG1_02_63_36]|nr:MAG: radical SAM protein [Elusimicrobia bacterium CG1_02_63_36]PIP83005.1 MAG: radical SAM protein [Elusimicrobia bacterium CG22_combo_CG10-13_8_21_14_all_63_91]PJA17498.1 MAG: radical SAM protein [Elusimicrobia bacterium CG_4_10_14_0_2_um_filter_63_34]PJB25430.1 MAG: radical SAM protein [Elusimicrobia bacterium CG_4_9_14_3_um_filter_62_55]
MSGMTDHAELILDGTKIEWYRDRIEAWERGEKIAPITIDMALTRACNFACEYCYAMLQENDRKSITKQVMTDFMDDCAEIGVKGVSFVSDGESTIAPSFVHATQHGAKRGLSIAVGTNGFVLHGRKLEEILPHMTYVRINITAGERGRYSEIMGVKPEYFDRIKDNIREMVAIKKRDNLPVTIGMQMVLMPQYEDQILPLARLGKELRADYLVIKHCSDNEDGDLGVDYGGYKRLYDLLREAEALSDEEYAVKVKWSKIAAEGKRSYQRCYGPPFMIQLSGSGLVAPCGMLFNEKYKKFHIGNIVDNRFKDIWNSDKYWEVMSYLAGPNFNAQQMCGSLCLQHKVNEYLDAYQKGRVQLRDPEGSVPEHLSFV